MESEREKADRYGQMVRFMMANGVMIWRMEKAYLDNLMAGSTKEISRTIDFMVLVNLSLQTRTSSIKDNFFSTCNMDMAHKFHTQKSTNTQEISKMMSSKVMGI